MGPPNSELKFKLINSANLCTFLQNSQKMLLLHNNDGFSWGYFSHLIGLKGGGVQIFAHFYRFIQNSPPPRNAISIFSRRNLILFVLSDRALMGASKLLHRLLKFINYANLCKFIQNSHPQKCCGPPNFYTEFSATLMPVRSTDL